MSVEYWSPRIIFVRSPSASVWIPGNERPRLFSSPSSPITYRRTPHRRFCTLGGGYARLPTSGVQRTLPIIAHCQGTVAAAYSAVRVACFSLLLHTVGAPLLVLRALLWADVNFHLVGPEWGFFFFFSPRADIAARAPPRPPPSFVETAHAAAVGSNHSRRSTQLSFDHTRELLSKLLQ